MKKICLKIREFFSYKFYELRQIYKWGYLSIWEIIFVPLFACFVIGIAIFGVSEFRRIDEEHQKNIERYQQEIREIDRKLEESRKNIPSRRELDDEWFWEQLDKKYNPR